MKRPDSGLHLPDEVEDLRATFLANTAHQLRTPLTRLILLSSSLARGLRTKSLSPDDALQRAEALAEEGEEMRRVLEQLIQLPKMAPGLLPLHLERGDLSQLVKSATERMLTTSKVVTQQVEMNLQAGVSGLWDEQRIDQIVTNLVSNALKFGDDKPIRVEVSAGKDWARITVHDSGKGMAPASVRRINGDSTRLADTTVAFGLGLWIVEQVARAMGGCLHAQSALGKGAAVSVDLPRNDAVADAAP